MIKIRSVLSIVFLFFITVISFAQAPNVEWKHTFSHSGGNDEGWQVQETRGCGLIVIGQATAIDPYRWDMYLIRTDPSGETLWTRTYYSNDFDQYGRAIMQKKLTFTALCYAERQSCLHQRNDCCIIYQSLYYIINHVST